MTASHPSMTFCHPRMTQRVREDDSFISEDMKFIREDDSRVSEDMNFIREDDSRICEDMKFIR